MKSYIGRFCLIFGFLIFGLASCESNGLSQKQSEIEQLEQSVKGQATQDDIEKLLTQYQSYISEYKNDSQTPIYMVRAAELSSRINRPQLSIELLERGYREYYNTFNNAANGLFLGNILREKLQNEILAQIVYKATLELFPNSIEVSKKTIDSTNTIPQILDNIGASLFNESTGKLDFLQANNFIEGSVLYAMMQPDNSLIADYLFKASETSRAIQKYSRTIDIYEWIMEKYPDYNKIAQIYFLYAFTLDNDLGKIEEARIAYNTFIANFPNSDFIDDAKFLIDNLGKSEEEIIESFNRN
jgi:tetratricopeptide (TPR) repeat protein